MNILKAGGGGVLGNTNCWSSILDVGHHVPHLSTYILPHKIIVTESTHCLKAQLAMTETLSQFFQLKLRIKY